MDKGLDAKILEIEVHLCTYILQEIRSIFLCKYIIFYLRPVRLLFLSSIICLIKSSIPLH